MSALDREALLEIPIGEIVPVDLKSGRVRVRAMNGLERERWENWCNERRKVQGEYCLRALLVIACCCDEAGLRLFDIDDYDAVCCLPASTVLIPIANAASKLNGLDGDENAIEGN